MTKKALVLAEFDDQGIPVLESLGYAVEMDGWGERRQPLSEDELAAMVDDVSLLVVEVEEVTSRVLEAAQDLELIAACRGTPSNIDLGQATTRGIPVLHTPGRNAESVADFTIGLMLAAGREICRADRHLRRSGWHVEGEIPYLYFRGPELADKNLALLGCGAIGRALARRAGALRMNVLGYDPYVSQGELEGLIELVSFDVLLAQADFLSLHVPVTEETRHMIGEDEIARMKQSAYLINTARADVVAESALYQALQGERLAGAALDVFWQEPLPAHSPWLDLDNVILTPHIAGAADDVKVYHTAMVIEDVRRFVHGRRPFRVANPEVFDGGQCLSPAHPSAAV